MKKRLLPLMLLILITSMSFAQMHTIKVTVPDTTIVCYVVGSFNNWNPATSVKMTKINDAPKKFSVVVDFGLPDTSLKTVEYKFLSGQDWAYQQKKADNFKFLTDSATAVVDTFDAIYNPIWEGDVTIDVLVPTTVIECYLTGSFNGWDPTANKMDSVTSSVNGTEYKLTVHALDTVGLEYKFIAGPGWTYQQTASNYVYRTDGGTVVCDAFKAIYNPKLIGDVTITITVPKGTPDVYLIGDFSIPNWSLANAIHATKNLDGTYTAVIPGIQTCQYKCWNYPDWPYEEALDSTGASLPNNRTATFATDPTISITVVAWKQVYVASGVQKFLPNTYKAYSNSGSIIVEGVNSGVAVYDLMGRLMDNSRVNGTFVSRQLKTGIYIVRIDNETKKVYVW